MIDVFDQKKIIIACYFASGMQSRLKIGCIRVGFGITWPCPVIFLLSSNVSGLLASNVGARTTGIGTLRFVT